MKKRNTFILVWLVWFVSLAPASAACPFQAWQTYKETDLLKYETSNTYLLVNDHMKIDADGAPNAYHPDNIGLDYLANAGYPDMSWWPDVLVSDPDNPAVAYQQQEGEFKGYFISKTALFDASKKMTDTARFVDARKIPYLVYPSSFYSMPGTGRLGDFGYALNTATGDASWFVVADIGPKTAKLGEVSIALAEKLGGKNVNPRTGAGAPKGNVLYVIFPYTSRDNKWPVSEEQIQRVVEAELDKIGGKGILKNCYERNTE